MSVTGGSLVRCRKLCQKLGVKSNLLLRGGGGGGRGLGTTRHACASTRGGWAPSGRSTCAWPLEGTGPKTPPPTPAHTLRSVRGLYMGSQSLEQKQNLEHEQGLGCGGYSERRTAPRG